MGSAGEELRDGQAWCLEEIAPGVTVEDVQRVTEPRLMVSAGLKEIVDSRRRDGLSLAMGGASGA
ncbi:MAG: hypothetical protein WCB76_03800 [Acidobacteriaceae bacterium]